ncbi:TPA: hypothetical protein DEW49_05115 [bacterium]|uniref:Uncharacterized protein n=2 Tax=Candidatus Ratteibacteria TaxID=2979319 RepID=A0A2M7GY72_9BACT|nr:MAG: hypothetical protein COW28_04585 [bacterium (Candidatus Ratteibacteria) CG15_BIG_FIL_POST_REV_8_21_14_020_41_12]HCG77255.1 hypothetical protein [bacterium]
MKKSFLLWTQIYRIKQDLYRKESLILMLSAFISVLFTYPLPAMGKEERNDYSIIYQRNIFGGSTARKEMKTILKPVEIPLSERFLLKGIIIKKNGSSLAVIENIETKIEDIYQVGDIIAGGEITLIEPTRVVIKNKNEEIPLFFAYGEVSFRGLVLQSSLKENSRIIRMKEALKKVSEASSLSRVRVKPVLSSGKVDGYEISNIPPDPFFEAMGIENGDKIKMVNGALLTSIPKAFEIYRTLKPHSLVEVEIVRDGKPLTLKYKLEE